MSANDPPWASGPGEILRPGLGLLKKDSDANRRLAMISVDNAVELMIKTYLGLPKRITGLPISRKEYQEIAESFPALLDALEKHAGGKIVGIDLGEIEWYHRLRNQLYHQGNGLTVERRKVEFYAQLANLLFQNLFGVKLVDTISDESDLIAEFWDAWRDLEVELRQKVTPPPPGQREHFSVRELIKALPPPPPFSDSDYREFEMLQKVRNAIAHARSPQVPVAEVRKLILTLQDYTNRVRKL